MIHTDPVAALRAFINETQDGYLVLPGGFSRDFASPDMPSHGIANVLTKENLVDLLSMLEARPQPEESSHCKAYAMLWYGSKINHRLGINNFTVYAATEHPDRRTTIITLTGEEYQISKDDGSLLPGWCFCDINGKAVKS
ncbi:hypothetical protein [Thalassospira xiamenensis]|uniref:Uncharacterized protein n=1 Tax=Thalassospira xiamenensis TaxID=220697 RepID=A0A285TXE6_9PROT|nr:hypothetical protein [Thalassospira xiamenensis]SOC30378.1 hypothetical protein SAMN05428964_10923 [Thalassospira xiamenensis]